MNTTRDLLCQSLPDWVRDWELENTIVHDTHTVHTSIRSDPARGNWHARVDDKWDHVTELGSGTFGDVSLQRCAKMGKVQAVKKCRMRLFAPDDAKSVSQELMAIVKFSHEKYRPWFVQCFGWYCSGQLLCINMEYIPMGDLEMTLRNTGNRLTEGESKRISRQILEAVSFMHVHDYVHRDLKPSNLLVQVAGPNWWIKISDFGTSKRIESTNLHTRAGTEAYFAPEYHPFLLPPEERTYTYTSAVDIWAIGAITFRIATGKLPFRPPPSTDLERYVRGGSFPVDHSLTDESNSFIFSLMGPYPSERPTALQALKSLWLGEASPAPDAATPDIVPESNVSGSKDASDSSTVPGSVDSVLLDAQESTEYSNKWSTTDGAAASDTEPNTYGRPLSLVKARTPPPDHFDHHFDPSDYDFDFDFDTSKPETESDRTESTVTESPESTLTDDQTTVDTIRPSRASQSKFMQADFLLYPEFAPPPEDFEVSNMAFSPDGAWFAVNYVKIVYIWNRNMDGSQELVFVKAIRHKSSLCFQVGFTPDSHRFIALVACGEDEDAFGGARVDEWKLDTQRRTVSGCQTVLQITQDISIIPQLDPNGQFSTWTMDEDERITYWKARSPDWSFQTISIQHLLREDEGPKWVEFLPEACRTLGFVGGKGYHLILHNGQFLWRHVFDVNPPGQSERRDDAQMGFSPDCRWFFMDETPEESRLWKVEDNGMWQLAATVKLAKADSLRSLFSFSADSRRLAVRSLEGDIIVWNLNDEVVPGGQLEGLVISCLEDELGAIALSPDGQRLAHTICSEDKLHSVQTWEHVL